MPATTSARSPAATAGAKRKLTAILSADVAGFSRLMGADEAGTHRTLTAYRGVIDGLVAGRGGRVVGAAGDSVLADFPSVVDAVACAVEIQAALRERNAALPAERRLEFRVGINLGDVIVDGGDIYGDGVNAAARLQALAEPGGICISGGVHEQVRGKLDLRYRDRGAQRVKNIAEPVRVYAVELADGAAARSSPAKGLRLGRAAAMAALGLALVAAVAAAALWLAAPRLADRGTPERGTEAPAALAAKPALAVLPFTNLSGDPEQDYFSDGVTEDVIAALGRFPDLLVIAWGAVAPYKAETATPEEVSRDLGVRYVVRGSVRRAGDRVRVTVQLTDAARGVLLWSERYDEAAGDIFAVQDAITRRVAGALAVKLTALEQERAFAKPTDSLDAYDYVLRGRQYLYEGTRSANFKARELFREAIALDPDYAAAHVGLGRSHVQDASYGWTEWPGEALQRAHDLARTAIGLDEADASAHALLSEVHSLRGQYDLAADEAQRAIELNPSDAHARATYGWTLVVLGRPEEAVRSLEAALRFNPTGPVGWLADLGFAYYLAGQYREAIRTGERCASRYPDMAACHVVLAAAYAQADRLDDAARIAERVRWLQPFFDADEYGAFFANPADRERVREGLRKAGLE